MGKCVTCGRFVSPKVAATCALCHGAYHRRCEGLEIPEDVAVPKDWLCNQCEKRTGTSSSTASICDGGAPGASPAAPSVAPAPAAPSPVALTGVGSPSALPVVPSFDACKESDLQGRLDEYMREQREFREEIRAAWRSLTNRMEGVERRLDVLEGRVTEAEATPCGGEVKELQQTVSRLQLELNDRDQDALLADLDIGHIPEERGENVVHTVTIIAAKLGVTLEPRDVVFAERVGAPGQGGAGARAEGEEAAGRPRRVVVRLARRQLRDELLRAARVRRTFTSADAGLPGPPRRIYCNERLTRTNRLLFYRVREECRSQRWRFAWTSRGRVYARQSDGKQAFCIRSDADLQRVFGSGAV